MAGIKRTAADNWFSLYVRARDGWKCQRCGRQYRYIEGGDNTGLQGLHDAHCFGRRAMSTRFEPTNSLACCYGCHSYIDSNPEEKREFFISKIGQEEYDRLRLLSNVPLYNAKRIQKDIASRFRELFYTLTR